jgi:tetratricopeptide (TPR) repeat protein
MDAALKQNAAALTDDQVIEECKKGGDLIQKAIKSGMIDEKKLGEAYKLSNEFSMRINNLLLAYASNHAAFDTVLFYNNLKTMTDGLHNELKYTKEVKGETGNIKYLESRKANLASSGDYFIYAAQFENECHRVQNALDAYELAMNYKKNYPEIADMCKLRIPEEQIAYYAFHAAHDAGMFDAMDKYYETALKFEDGALGTKQVKLQSYLEKGDTATWAKNVEDVCLSAPKENEDLIQILLNYYQKKGPDQMEGFADRVLGVDKDVLIANYGKAFVLFQAKKYEEALKYYERCTEIKPNYYDAWYQAGLCKFSQAMEKNSTISSIKDQKKAKATLEETKNLFGEAIPYFEKARESAPDEPNKWAFELKQCYSVTGQSAKAAEMDKLLD